MRACVPLCITNCNPQQTGTKISALWAVWLKLFMLCHCELSPQSYRLCAVTVKCSQKHAPCRAMLCVVACPLHVTVASYFLHVTVKAALCLSHAKRPTQCYDHFCEKMTRSVSSDKYVCEKIIINKLKICFSTRTQKSKSSLENIEIRKYGKV